ncbi:NADH-ubiquinone oxidoreductase-F iron-sulfur binding region domain-containing protein [Nocardioides sp.]|uniref:NADH-ubiquinone oxidoreductase-F iron-sulfur binding region domain-containing protein n=1 Tax=Nocardioides sp. TaxID=35761 RepID=UPI003D0C0591
MTAVALPDTRPLLSLAGLDAAEHLDRIGPLPCLGLEELLAVADHSGLTGRGGAGFPTAIKLRAVASARSPVVVGNAMEGEPLSHKDAVLLARVPHLVLDGLALVGTAVRARRRLLAVGPEVAAPGIEPLARACGVEVLRLSGGFIAGQESALVNQIDGRRAVPADPLIRVTTSGAGGRATLVSNIETLAHLALAARNGADWFRSRGTPEDPGTSLFSISGAVARPGVVEADRGSRLTDVLTPAGPLDPVAVLVGGYHGAWVPVASLDIALTRSALAPFGAQVGAGVLHVLDTHTCPLRRAAEITGYLAGESAGQCGPCINGLPRMADALGRLATGHRDPALVTQIDRMRLTVAGRGACAHPDGTARFVASTLRTFHGDVEAHLAGRCTAAAR